MQKVYATFGPCIVVGELVGRAYCRHWAMVAFYDSSTLWNRRIICFAPESNPLRREPFLWSGLTLGELLLSSLKFFAGS